MEQEELTARELTLTVQLPEGQEGAVTVNGSKPVMDLLVSLCAKYHLNPSDHVIQLISSNQNQIKFKPNSLIGSLEPERVVLKHKQTNDSRASNVPVKTVRLIVNYRNSQKAVLRVNPRAPLADLMVAICEKCELDPTGTVLWNDSQSQKLLDLTKSLNDYGIKDLYAKEIKGCEEQKLTQEKGQGGKENRGLLKKSRKTTDEREPNTSSASTSSVLNNQVNISCFQANSSTPSSDMPRKKQAPQPPCMPGSHCISSGPISSQDATLPIDTHSGKTSVLGISSSESSLKRIKRRAPPPPCISPSLPDQDSVQP